MTSLNEEVKVGFRMSGAVEWVFMVIVAMILLVGGVSHDGQKHSSCS